MYLRPDLSVFYPLLIDNRSLFCSNFVVPSAYPFFLQVLSSFVIRSSFNLMIHMSFQIHLRLHRYVDDLLSSTFNSLRLLRFHRRMSSGRLDSNLIVDDVPKQHKIVCSGIRSHIYATRFYYKVLMKLNLRVSKCLLPMATALFPFDSAFMLL